jgi:SnoaL-like domain
MAGRRQHRSVIPRPPQGLVARARLRGVELPEFRQWLDAYGRAWEARDPRAAANLYAEDGSYQVTPFVAPLRGRQAIFDYWTEVARTEREIEFQYDILGVTPGAGIAHWQASFLIEPPGLKTKLDGIFVIRLNSTGLCVELHEWWHKQQ